MKPKNCAVNIAKISLKYQDIEEIMHVSPESAHSTSGLISSKKLD